MIDGLKVTLVVGLTALFCAVICLSYVAWANAGSRNLALSTATLAAALILFLIQLPFELRSTSSSDFFTAEYTIDREAPRIRQWNYSVISSGWRLSQEVGASDKLAATQPEKFQGDREKMTHDMVIFSLLSYFGAEQFDWQLKRTQFKGPSTGVLTKAQSISREDECATFSIEGIHQKFIDATNLFANGPIFVHAGRLCLPPETSLDIRIDGLQLTNPFCRILFALEPSGATSYVQPGTSSLEAPKLLNGESRFETRPTGVRVTTEFNWIRAQHRDLAKYKEWSARVVDGARRWFEGDD